MPKLMRMLQRPCAPAKRGRYESPSVPSRAPRAGRPGRFLLLAGLLLAACSGRAQNPADPGETPGRTPSAVEPLAAQAAQAALHELQAGDVIQVKVYQEEDLTAVVRVGKDGTVTLPLLGPVRVASNTVNQASVKIHDLLAADYLVNPRVTLNVIEFAKRRFTVLGQVQRPGSYEIPPDESVSLLQAIAMAGGYTRIGNPRKITVQRLVAGKSVVLPLDAQAMASRKNEKSFEILPEDVIVVGEKWL